MTGSKRIFSVLLLLAVMLPGCGEDSVKEDISVFNKSIELRTDINSARNVMVEFYNTFYGAVDEKCKITEENLTPGRYRVTLTREPIFEGPKAAEKFVMIVKFDGMKWKVLIVEKSWKCKGNQTGEWGIESCN